MKRIPFYIIWIVVFACSLIPIFSQEEGLRSVFRSVSLPVILIVNLMASLFVFYLWSRHRLPVVAYLWKIRRSIFGIFILFTFFTFKVSNEFRVLSDEANILGVSHSMHYDNTPTIGTMGRYSNDNYIPIVQKDPKRPIEFSSLIFLAHRIAGYNWRYGFMLNNLLLLLVFLLLFIFFERISDKVVAWSAVLLFSSQPAFILTAFSSGFDFFALTLVFVFFFSVYCYQTQHHKKFLFSWLILWLLLLYSRYEYILFASILFVIGIFKDFQAHRQCLKKYHLPLMFSLLLVFPRIYQHILTSTKHAESFSGPTFSLLYVKQNILELWKGLSQLSDSPYTFGLLFLFLAALIIKVVGTIRIRSKIDLRQFWNFESLLWIVFVFTSFAVYLTHYFGKSTHPAGYRLYLLPMFCVMMGTIFLFRNVSRNFKIALIICCVLLNVHAGRVVAHDPFLAISPLARSTNRILETLLQEGNNHNEIIVVDERPGHYTILGFSAFNFSYLRNHMDSVQMWFKNKNYEDMILIQRIDKSSGAPTKDSKLPDGFKLIPIKEFHYNRNTNIRMSRWDFLN